MCPGPTGIVSIQSILGFVFVCLNWVWVEREKVIKWSEEFLFGSCFFL